MNRIVPLLTPDWLLFLQQSSSEPKSMSVNGTYSAVRKLEIAFNTPGDVAVSVSTILFDRSSALAFSSTLL